MTSRSLTNRVVIGGAVLAVAAFGRSISLRWGAKADELDGILPGDELVGKADLVSTRGITIDCKPADVWPWLAQLGQGRGGFYSYDFLENLIGCDIHSADRIVPDWQQVSPGDDFRLHPNAAMQVAIVEPDHALVVRGGIPVGGDGPPFDFSWAFVVRHGNHGTTRLLVRERYRYLRWWAVLMVEPTEFISFVMSHKMLTGIKRRAEGVSGRGVSGQGVSGQGVSGGEALHATLRG